MRSLIYAPIVHSEVDLGTMASEVRRHFQDAFGAEEWTRRFASVEVMWEGIRTKLIEMPIAWAKARLYQDGLPMCDREPEIVRDLALQGSLNHKLLAELMELGATLMGTESPELLLKEYRRIQALLEIAHQRMSDSVVEELRREGDRLLAERDAFIARRIDTTLNAGETGILFVGLLHRVDELLDGRFEVHHVIHNLPFGADPWRKLMGQRGNHDN